MAIRGAFASGFLQGFDKSITEGIEERKKRMEELIDQSISTAKRVAPAYAKTKAELTTISRIGDDLKRDFGLKDEEFVALAQSTDVKELYKTVYQDNEKRLNAGLPKLSKQEILSGINIPDGFVMPKGETRDSMLQKVFGLQTQALQQEEDPNSEGAKNRSFGKALMEFFVSDPTMSAEQRLKNMKLMGVDVNTLLAYEKSGGTKQQVIPGVERTSVFSVPQYDYTDEDMSKTQRTMYSTLTKRVTGVDFNNPVEFANYSGDEKDKTAIKTGADDTAYSLAKLELQLVRTNMGNLSVAGRTPRAMLLRDIAGAVESQEDLAKLRQTIESGKAIEIINKALQEKGTLSEEDYQALFGETADDTVMPEVEAAPEATPSVIKEDPELISKVEGLDEDSKAAVLASLKDVTDPQVARMVIEKAAEDVDVPEDGVEEQLPMPEQAEKNILDATDKAKSVLDDENKTNQEKATEVLDILMKDAALEMPTNREELGYFMQDIADAFSQEELNQYRDVFIAIMAKASERVKG